jgi:hypothetical protein
MPLVKFADRIHTAADRGFHKIQPKGTNTTMNISHLSAAERNQIAKKISEMSYDEQKQLLDQLNAPKAYTRVDARSESDANLKNRTLTRVEAELRRLGLSSDGVQASAKKKFNVYEIDRAAKAAVFHSIQTMALKSDMGRLGMLAE